MPLLTWILLLPATIIVIAFAIANRSSITISFDPLPFAFDAPIYAVAFAFVFIGLLVGGIAAYTKALRWRRVMRRLRREVTRLEGEVAAARTAPPAPSDAETRPTLPAVSDAA